MNSLMSLQEIEFSTFGWYTNDESRESSEWYALNVLEVMKPADGMLVWHEKSSNSKTFILQ